MVFAGSTTPVLVAGLLVMACFSTIKDFTVFPHPPKVNYTFCTDSTSGGDAKILTRLVTDSLLKFDYQISTRINAPDAGLRLSPKEAKTIDVAHYNEPALQLRARS